MDENSRKDHLTSTGGTENAQSGDSVVSLMFRSFEELALNDIDRAISGRCMLGAVILAACFVDYMAKLSQKVHGAETGPNGKPIHRFVSFVKRYMTAYDAELLYTNLRCDLVHAYTGFGAFGYIADQQFNHYRKDSDGKTYINVQSFVSDVKNAFCTFRDEVLGNPKSTNVLAMSLGKREIGFMVVKEIDFDETHEC